jgi:hypothetical protein
MARGIDQDEAVTTERRRQRYRRADDLAAHEAGRRIHALRLKLQSLEAGLLADPVAHQWAAKVRLILDVHEHDFDAVERR